MTFISILLALVAEQYKSVEEGHWVRRMTDAWLDWIIRSVDDGRESSARLVCLAAIIPPAVFVLAIHLIFLFTQPVLAFIWNVLIVYLFLGFRQFSHPFTAIHEALLDRDLELARQLLAEWQGAGLNTENMTESEVVRIALERAIVGCHRHVFGPIFWFLLPLGPAGVVIYRLADRAMNRWGSHASPAAAGMMRQFFYYIDWVPTRLTAIGFAIVGNFEDAMYGWRYHLRKWSHGPDAVILAVGAGALGVRLGAPLPQPDSDEALRMAEAGEPLVYEVGLEPTERTMRSAIGLVWRLVIAWMILLLMLTIALWLG